MRTITDREKRTIRLGAAAIVVYLALYFGLQGWRMLEAKRTRYEQMVVEAQRFKRDLLPYENRVLLAQKLRETSRIDLNTLSRGSVVADVSAAIQKAAGSIKVQIGHVRESAARSSAKEIASMQLDGSGPIPAIMTLLHRLETLGYPVIVDSLQINGDPTKPGMVKISLTLIILDFEQWKSPEVRNA